MRRAVVIAMLAVLASAALLGPPSLAAPAGQRADQLDAPLLWANMCGAGAPGEVHFTLAATGDTFPHENIQAAAEANGYDWLFDHVRPFLQAADLAYTNFDGAMLEHSPHSGYPLFNYSPRLAAALRNAGIGLVSTANNHILDRGPEGLDATLAVLAGSGIAQHGTVASADAAAPRPPYLPLTLTREGVSIRIGFVSASWGTNGIPDPYGQVNLLWQGDSYGGQGGVRQSTLDAVAQAVRETDLVVVAAHWGEEYQFYPQPYHIDGARQLAEAGADVILGAQPHTLQPVDILDVGGRKALVIYSLANFLASQGAFQSELYTATATVFYVGLVRQADGAVRVTGYRYLPTIHVDGDTRPAPLAAEQADALAHVRLMMRDPGGARQVPGDPALLGGRVEVCPALRFSEVPGVTLGGDFAQHYATLGGGASREPRETIAVLGLPLGAPAVAMGADCARQTVVLTTERQRLEWDPAAPWPYRVLGARLGAEAFRRRYGQSPQPRTDLAGGAFGDERFHAFFDSYGGLPVFGYPISAALAEPDPAGGAPLTVQYFERARLELVPGAAPGAELLAQVRVAPLGREALAQSWVCDAAPLAQAPGVAEREAGGGQPRAPGAPPLAASAGAATPAPPRVTPAVVPAATAGEQARSASAPAAMARAVPRWLWPALGLVGLAAVAALAYGSYARAMRCRARAARRRRLQPSDDEELLRRLLG